ncbi:recombinase family protein [Geodermatophilus sp. DSM 44513]|nr:recombinase family protein [Geodermatophilus sp. DSM 44513]WNV75920.1 recombinase family protein [Geodermatophilus sp. DSM 44513]
MKAAAVYARISSDTEGRALGVARQVEDCRRLAEQLGWPVAQEYMDNDVSAYSSKARRRTSSCWPTCGTGGGMR